MNALRAFSHGGLLTLAFTIFSVFCWSNGAHGASLKLNWADLSSTEQGFKIERATGTTGSFSLLATVGANVRSYRDSTVSTGNTYCYRVRSYNSAGTSSPSNQACANVARSSTPPVNLGSSGGGSTSGSAPSSSGPSLTSISPSTSTQQYVNSWANYRFMVKMKSIDDDVIGVMFRYVDHDNYYRFLWYREKGLRRLQKRVNGKFYTIVEDAVQYNKGQTYDLEIIANGSNLNVRIDDSEIFSDVDSSIKSGTIALYSNYNAGNIYDDVLVQDLATGAVRVWEDFNDGKANGWVIVNEGGEYGSSNWTVSNGTLVQSSNIGSSKGRDWLGTYALFTN